MGAEGTLVNSRMPHRGCSEHNSQLGSPYPEQSQPYRDSYQNHVVAESVGNEAMATFIK